MPSSGRAVSANKTFLKFSSFIPLLSQTTTSTMYLVTNHPPSDTPSATQDPKHPQFI